MTKRLLIAVFAILMVSPSWGQDSSQTTSPPKDEDAEAADGEDASEGDIDGLDEQGYGEQDEDVFIPSEEVPLDQDIPFPTDI